MNFRGRPLYRAVSPVAHARASENKVEKGGTTFSSSVRDFQRLFLSV